MIFIQRGMLRKKQILHYDFAGILNPRVEGRFICFEVVGEKKRPEKCRIRCDSEHEAEKWVAAIERARTQMRQMRKIVDGAPSTPRGHRPGSNYEDQALSPLRSFGRANQGLLLPGMPDLKVSVENAEGKKMSTGNTLVPDEELCVGTVSENSVLVIEDRRNGRVLRFHLKLFAGVERCERELELLSSGEEEKKGAQQHVKIRLRFESDRRRHSSISSSSRSSNRLSSRTTRSHSGGRVGGEHSTFDTRRRLGTLLLSLVFVVVSLLYFVLAADVELTGLIGMWGLCMTLITALLGQLAVSDGLLHYRKTGEHAQQQREEEPEMCRILHVSLLNGAKTIGRPEAGPEVAEKEEVKGGEWNYDGMMARLEKNPTENLANPDLLEDVGLEVKTPVRFLNCEPGDPTLARLRWRHTTWFRKTFGFLSILEKPHPLLHVIKKYWPNYYYGQDRTGSHPVFFDKPAGVDLKSLYKLGITDADLCYHYVWITEFCYTHLCQSEDDLCSCITVYNMEGLDFSLVMGQKKKFIMKTTKIFEQHYPERSHKMYFLKTPGWFNWVAWPIIKSLANAQTLEKIQVFSSGGVKFMNHISQFVDPERLPAAWGGESDAPMDQSPSELKMIELAEKVCADHGVEMLTESELEDEMQRGACSWSHHYN